LGTSFLQGFDKLLVYNIVSNIRTFYRDYGLKIGGASVSQDMAKRFKKSKEMDTFTAALRNLEKTVGENFESLDSQLLKNYQTMTKLMTKGVLDAFIPQLNTIGTL
jgi:hypothetical protein